MTDKEIIKALECCADESSEKCDECPYSIDTFICKRREFLEDTFELINHKQELLEAAIAGQETLQKALAEKEKEIERLTAEKEQLIKIFGECQTEAVKDFAKRLLTALMKAIFRTRQILLILRLIT